MQSKFVCFAISNCRFSIKSGIIEFPYNTFLVKTQIFPKMNIKLYLLAIMLSVISAFKLFPLSFNNSIHQNKIPDRIYAA